MKLATRVIARAVCLALLAVCALGAYALRQTDLASSRGLNLGSPTGRPANLYGINVHLVGSPDIQQRMAALKAQGFGWVRQPFDWQHTDTAAAEAFLSAAQASGLKVVVVLTGAAPPDPVAFAAWVGRFADVEGNQVDAYEIWDEPNLGAAWGGTPNPAAYAHLLQAAYTAIHAVRPNAVVLLGGLAPTTETGPRNLSDVLFLRALYSLGAGPYFDAVSGKPYGFSTGPDDRRADPAVLNFSRLILLREEMVAHGDSAKFLWGSNFGWNTRPSIWGQVTPDQQHSFATGAYLRARDEWPWTGPLFLETPLPDDAADSPHAGFAIANRPLALQSAVGLQPGTYAFQSMPAYAQFNGNWKFSDLGADIPQSGPADLSFQFQGTGLSLTVRRADYRAYLYITIDGAPARGLPNDTQGQAYLVLTAPDLQARVDTLPVSGPLGPGLHTLALQADRGWDQWSLVSVTVAPDALPLDTRFGWWALSAVAILACVGLGLTWRGESRPSAAPEAHPSRGLSWAAAAASLVLWAAAALTWGNLPVSAFRRYGDFWPLVVTALTATVFYFSPALVLVLISAFVLFVLFYLRPALALPLIAFFAPFYLQPRQLYNRAFSMVEICTLLAVASLLLHALTNWAARWRDSGARPNSLGSLLSAWFGQWRADSPWLLDLSVAAFVVAAGLSLPGAEVRSVALREFRDIVLEPALFYFMLRFVPLERRQLWRVVDYFLAGALVVAVYGLTNLITGDNLITAEGGIPRIGSVYGSPNNVGLFLGRAIGIAAAVALFGRYRNRRIAYAVALLPILATAVLSLSRGALVFGLPAIAVVLALFWGGRRAAVALAGIGGLGVVALALLSRLPRFADLFSTSSGTGFFRVNVWRSAWAMFLDHPWTGVGLDNFLYAYRGHYIQPEAWQDPNLPHAHNVFLDSLTRTGLIGLAALLWMLGAVLLVARQAWKAVDDPDLRALIVGLLACLADAFAHGQVDTAYWFVDLAYAFMLVLGLMAALPGLPDPAGIIESPRKTME